MICHDHSCCHYACLPDWFTNRCYISKKSFGSCELGMDDVRILVPIVDAHPHLRNRSVRSSSEIIGWEKKKKEKRKKKKKKRLPEARLDLPFEMC